MALYMLSLSDGTTCLVREANGDLACDHAPREVTGIARIKEEGPYGFLSPEATQASLPLEEDNEPADDERDITSLDDKPGTRRFLNIVTGASRTVLR